MTRKLLVYVAGPYTGATPEEVESNIAVADAHGKEVLLVGHLPIVPHTISGYWDQDERFAELGHSDWMDEFCFPLLARCDAIFLIPGWETSRGANAERGFAIASGIRIIHDVAELGAWLDAEEDEGYRGWTD